jgi:hypothetical protein
MTCTCETVPGGLRCTNEILGGNSGGTYGYHGVLWVRLMGRPHSQLSMHAGSASALLGGRFIHSSACTATDSRACQRMVHGVLGRYSGYSQVLPGCSQGTHRTQNQGRGEAHVPLLYLVRPRKHMVWSTRVLGDTLWTRWPPQIHGYSGVTHRAPLRLLARDFTEPALVRTRRPSTAAPSLPPSAVPSSAPTSAAPTPQCATPKLSCTASLRPDGMAVAC